MAPSWMVNDSAGPEIFQSVKSLPLKRLVNPGSTTGALCKAAARIRETSSVEVRMRGSLPPGGPGVDCAPRTAQMRTLMPLRLPFAVVLLTIALALVPGHAQDPGQNAPLRLAIAGLVHG